MADTKSAESVASLVERLEKRAEYYEKAGAAIPTALVSSIQLETAKELREAASRLSSPEGTRGNRAHICGDPNDACDQECADKFYEAQERRKSSPSSAPAATPATYAQESGDTRNNLAHTRNNQSWAVEVRSNGETVVTIEDRCLSGRDLSEADQDLIRKCADHLNAFVGQASPRVSAATPAPARELCSKCGGNGTMPIRNGEGQRIGIETCQRCQGDCWEPVSAAERPAPTCDSCELGTSRVELMRAWLTDHRDATTNATRHVAFNDALTFVVTLFNLPAPPGPVAQE